MSFVFVLCSSFFLFPFLRLFQEILVFSAHFQAVAVNWVPQSSATGNCAKQPTKKGNFALTPSTPTPGETFRAMLLLQDSDPMTQALG